MRVRVEMRVVHARTTKTYESVTVTRKRALMKLSSLEDLFKDCKHTAYVHTCIAASMQHAPNQHYKCADAGACTLRSRRRDVRIARWRTARAGGCVCACVLREYSSQHRGYTRTISTCHVSGRRPKRRAGGGRRSGHTGKHTCCHSQTTLQQRAPHTAHDASRWADQRRREYSGQGREYERHTVLK